MKILNFGSLNLDHIYHVPHLVRPQETVLGDDLELVSGGKGLNQSVALALAGLNVYHAGAIGKDGKSLLEVCRNYGIDTQFVKCGQTKTGHAIVQVDSQGQNCILLYGGANFSITLDHIEEALEPFEAGDYLIVQNEINDVDVIIEKAAEKDMIIVLNPSPYRENITHCHLDRIHYLILNEIEGAQMTGLEDPRAILKAIVHAYPNLKVVLTLGDQGALYLDEAHFYEQPIYPVDVVDTTAAGDTFTGYFIAGMLRYQDVQEALKLASKAASYAVGHKGASSSIPSINNITD